MYVTVLAGFYAKSVRRNNGGNEGIDDGLKERCARLITSACWLRIWKHPMSGPACASSPIPALID